MAEVTKQPAASDPPAEARQPTWLRFFQSASGPTLITVLLGGIFGTAITATVQHALSAREQVRAQEKALVSARLKTVHEAFALLGRMMGTAEDLIVSRGPEYNPERFGGSETELARVTEQLHAINTDYNAADRQWRAAQYSYALLLAYYHPGKLAVPARWSALADVVSGYVGCARDWAVANDRYEPYDGSCDAKRKKVNEAIAQLSEAIVGSD